MSPRSASRVASESKKSNHVRDAADCTRRKEAPKSRPRGARAVEEVNAGSADVEDEDAPSIGDNLRRLRTERNLSLDALAQMSSVSRAMLGQIELKRSVPTITVLWRIAKALELPFSALMSEPTEKGPAVLRKNAARFLTSADGSFRSRALFPPDWQSQVEFYEVRLAPGAVEEASPHAAGTFENLVVSKGSIEVRATGEPITLATGDAMVFRADVAHRYENTGNTEAVVYMVITYAQRSG
ncbi:MAG: cupin domain-containing protein [Polyangiaceae bacterium]